jgi:hypothetical protein
MEKFDETFHRIANWGAASAENATKEAKMSAEFSPPDSWFELVESCPDIELYPGERPKTMENVIHELQNWLACFDADWKDNFPCYQQGEKTGTELDPSVVKLMEEFWEKKLDHISIPDVLRKISF